MSLRVLDLGDAPAKQITVTQENIDDAVVRNSGHCIIAEAVKQSVPEARSVAVDLQTIRFSDTIKRERYVYLTTRAAQEVLVNFDQGIKPEPFKFSLHRGATTAMKSPANAQETYRKQQLRRPPGSPSSAPVPVGGSKNPPRGALGTGAGARGRRREFGIKKLAK